jgi:hypothetical protein
MKLEDIYEEKKFTSHTENDIISIVQKVIDGPHSTTLGLELISSKDQRCKGTLIFKDNGDRFKIDYDGIIYKNNKEIGKVKKSSDLHSQYSNAMFKLIDLLK